MAALVVLVKRYQERSDEGLHGEMVEKIGEELGSVLWEQLEKIGGNIEESWTSSVGQASRLMDFDWELDM